MTTPVSANFTKAGGQKPIADPGTCCAAALEAYFRVGRFQKSRPPAYDYVDRFSK